MKRGRQSVEDRLTVVPVSGARMEPPEFLTDAEAAEWRDIVSSLPADYFRPSDVALLAAFCTASAVYKQARALIAEKGLVIADERGKLTANPASQILTAQASSMAQMAGKLRLCPSSRYNAKSANTKANSVGAGSKPWQQSA